MVVHVTLRPCCHCGASQGESKRNMQERVRHGALCAGRCSEGSRCRDLPIGGALPSSRCLSPVRCIEDTSSILGTPPVSLAASYVRLKCPAV